VPKIGKNIVAIIQHKLFECNSEINLEIKQCHYVF